MGNEAVIQVEEDIQTDAINDMLGDAPADVVDDVIDDPTTDEVTTVDGDQDEGDEPTVQAESDNTLPTPDAGDVEVTPQVDTQAGAEGDQPEIVDDIEALRARIADMSAPAVVEAEGDEPVNPLDAFKEDVAYITEENLAQIAEDPLLLNAAMNNVRRETAQNLLSIVPQLIAQAVQAQATRTDVHNAFYSKHKELAPYKKYVSVVAKEVQTKNPDKSQEEIFDIVAKSVKTSLQLNAVKSKEKTKKVGAKPALRTSKGGGRVTVKKEAGSSQQDEIDDILS